ncbi:DMT family transporter [Nocardioides lianchengensis]|uniref:DMT family transporter n=1 Tax=Nocardioides lianchengensis TaxID=1045774 RepID=UPI000B84548B|nr:DMT family transporter [Nocardioides lianchengensis]
MEDQSSVIRLAARPGNAPPQAASRGWFLGLVGVVGFSFSLPANVWAVAGADPWTITVWRSLAAGILALAILRAARAPRPDRRALPALAVGGLMVGLAFQLLSSAAVTSIDPGRGAVILGLLPACTAVVAAVLGDERLPGSFWLASGTGVAVLTAYLLSRPGAGGDGFGTGDLEMLGAVVCASVGYAIGADQARTLGGPQSICWSLVVLLPLTLPLGVVSLFVSEVSWSPTVLGGFAYLVLVSQLLGFFAWYAGLARGGTARVSQVQQLQPLLTIAWSALLFAGEIDARTVAVGVAVGLLVWLAQRARLTRR